MEATHLVQRVVLIVKGQTTWLLFCNVWRTLFYRLATIPPFPIPYIKMLHSRHPLYMPWWVVMPHWNFIGFFYHMKIIYATKGPKKEGKKEETTLLWSRSHTWVEPKPVELGSLPIPNLFGRDSVVDRDSDFTRGSDNWVGYLPLNYRFY